jgi:YhcH/YjgK/YiaL family protein
MIIDNIKNLSFYRGLFPRLNKAFDFIESGLCASTPEKRYEIENGIYALVKTFLPKSPQELKPEVHVEYADLQYIISGSDIIGWKSLFLCKDVFKEYDAAKDIEFFNDKIDFQFPLNAGNFAFFFPADAHAPLCGSSTVKKCILKIKAELFYNENFI